jgi:hypothetical protein
VFRFRVTRTHLSSSPVPVADGAHTNEFS